MSSKLKRLYTTAIQKPNSVYKPVCCSLSLASKASFLKKRSTVRSGITALRDGFPGETEL
jgi:hypothetical protein